MQRVIIQQIFLANMEQREIAIDGTIQFATFNDRPNRFLVNLIPDGKVKTEKAFLHDPGRMKELLIDDARLLIRKPLNLNNRKTKWDILAVEHKGKLVTINSTFPNLTAKNALVYKWIPELSEYNFVKSEISYGNSRLDFLLTKDNLNCYVEVKGVTLVRNDIALFPDAPTTRGAKHVNELIEIVSKGHKGVILFVCMRDDPKEFAPNFETDPIFSETLQIAKKEGVDILVYKVKPILKNQQLFLQFKDKIKVNM